MISQTQYATLSLELHLFFARIMKEHSLFLEAGFTPKDAKFGEAANHFKEAFETILHHAIQLGNGIVSTRVISSGEIVTDYTLGSEQKTVNFTGIPINTDLTRLEQKMYGNDQPQISPQLIQQVKQLNITTLKDLERLIAFKKGILDHVLSCNIFTMNYPLLIEHILREAELYRNHIYNLEQGENIDNDIKNVELFWDQIMMEHAEFIRGLLDPSENALIITSNDFANAYLDLLKQTKGTAERMLGNITQTTLQQTMKYRDFKEAGTKGIAECQIRSIILPLLGDHVLREANHYIRLLRQYT